MDEPGAESDVQARSRRVRRTTPEIRALILDAARVVFAQRGFSGATTRHIAVSADVAEPLIFSNFGNKAALFAEAVIEPFNQRFREFLVYSETLPANREQRSAHFVHALYPFFRDHADLLLALVKSTREMGDGELHGLDDYFTRAATRMRSQFEQSGWEFDVPPEYVVRYAFGMMAGAVLFRDWFFPDQAPDEAMAEAMIARLLFKATEPRNPQGPPSIT